MKAILYNYCYLLNEAYKAILKLENICIIFQDRIGFEVCQFVLVPFEGRIINSSASKLPVLSLSKFENIFLILNSYVLTILFKSVNTFYALALFTLLSSGAFPLKMIF